LLVYIETVVNGRRVYLDYRQNPVDFHFEQLEAEARDYLNNSQALDKLPIERLRTMNPGAIQLYNDHGIDITREPLEIAVCAQHNNGGLAGTIWWESENVSHLFPIGEVNGSHGITRPGGTALNAGQVGGYRAAEYIANVYRQQTMTPAMFEKAARRTIMEVDRWLAKTVRAPVTWQADRDEFQSRMSRAGAHIRSSALLSTAIADARNQWRRLKEQGTRIHGFRDLMEGLRNLQLCYAHLVYLNAIHYAVESGIGSRGSALVLDESGESASEKLDTQWRFAPENADFRQKVLRTIPVADGRIKNEWQTCRPLPQSDIWFETAWAAFRNKDIYV
jgi:succinate dehydrogenase/fumarate reductase flavoprotein subunit